MFLALALVYSDYYKPTIAEIQKEIEYDSKILSATLIATGSSSAKLGVSLVDVFLTKNGIGAATIIGSGIFNTLVVVGIVSFHSVREIDGAPFYLNIWATCRDTIFNVISLTGLGWILLNEGLECVLADDNDQIYTNSSNQVKQFLLIIN
uniref:Sodium/calcium exchanger membrane region domain-containing protein n=1 Tax=Aplanochytrium stocchinoi TaxID=215587 RepID=A0A7S3PL92_9STRA|mmetsp:Transcript_5267/g.6638  ORF Transcript_5267/g.6638 Transcript_5267/m.6638 type:complete len:150 (+) Transcript_5267:367-816(+)